MQIHKKLTARLLSLVMSIAMITTMTSATVFADEGDAPLGRSGVGVSGIGTIQSFDKLEDRFEPSTGEGVADHVYGLAVELNTPVEDLNLPDALTAMVARSTTTEQETIPVTWKGDKEYKSDANGKFVYTAVLPEGYILADGVQLPQIYVVVGGKTRDARAGNITIVVNDGDTKSGTTLQTAVESNSGTASDVTSLKITAGEVTTADWNYLKSLSAMTTFEIADTIPDDKVTEILSSSPKNPPFPKSIETVTIPQKIVINENAFHERPNLKSVNLPKVKSITAAAFTRCTALETVNLPALSVVALKMFEGCTALTSISLPKATLISNEVFKGCTALEEASLPMVTQIENRAFINCTKLTTLKLGATPPSPVNAGVFTNCPETRFLGYVDANGNDLTGDALAEAIDAYTAAAGTDGKWYGWTIEPPKVSFTATINGVETTLSGDSLEAVLEGKESTVTSLKITAGEVTTADWNYLTSLPALTTFEIDAAVTEVVNIPDVEYTESIFPASIVTVTVPQAITIGNYAFADCTVLTTASFPAATSIGRSVFYGCTALTSASFPKVTTSIGSLAFEECAAFATLKLGATPPTIVMGDAFHGCPDTRALGYVDADGKDLTGDALTAAQAAYKAFDDDDTTDNLWYGWTIGAVGEIPDYTGTQAAAPSNTPVAMTATSITLAAVTVAGETVEYAMSTTNTAPAAGWQDSTAFTGLSEATRYYFFARVKANTTHKVGTASAGTAIATAANTLPSAIALANAAKTGIAINDNPASSVASGTRFVTTAEMAALDAAIAAAQAVADNTGSTEAEITTAIGTLNTAVTAFNAVIKTGTYSSGGGGSSSGGSTPSGNVIDNPVGTKTAPPAVTDAVKDAVAKGITSASTSVTFNNYTALAPDGIKAILDSVAAATKGTKVKLNLLVNFDAGPKNQVTSRITVDPAALAKELTAKNITGKLPLGVWFDQTKDTKVQSVNNLFGKHFSNKIVSVVYDQRNTLAVNAEFCAKLNLAETFGTDKNLYFYTYDNTTNIYKRILLPNYRVDKNGYAHITAPFGGSIIITDKPLTSK